MKNKILFRWIVQHYFNVEDKSVKNRALVALLYLFSGILLIVEAKTIFKICDASEMVMKCHWSAQAEIGLGILLITSGVLYFFSDDWKVFVSISILSVAIAVVAILIPKVLIGGCADSMMLCQSLTFPSFYLIATVTILFSIGNIIFLTNSLKLKSSETDARTAES